MFISYLSTYIYEREEWPLALHMEGMIDSFLREFNREWSQMSVTEIEQELHRCVAMEDLPKINKENLPTSAWIDAFIHREAPFAKQAALRLQNSEDLPELSLQQSLNMYTLKTCVANSESFRQFLESRRPPK